jgi:hypothetical protein
LKKWEEETFPNYYSFFFLLFWGLSNLDEGTGAKYEVEMHANQANWRNPTKIYLGQALR